MIDKPDVEDLLIIAHQELVNKLLPALPPEQREVALRISQAMGLAERGTSLSGPIERAALQRLRTLSAHAPAVGQALDQSTERPLHGQLQAAQAALRDAIRAGVFDEPGEAQRELLRHLAASAEDRLRITNPQKLY